MESKSEKSLDLESIESLESKSEKSLDLESIESNKYLAFAKYLFDFFIFFMKVL